MADFAIPARKLMIEVDGGQHALSGEADAARTEALRLNGYRVIRFWNPEVALGYFSPVSRCMASSRPGAAAARGLPE